MTINTPRERPDKEWVRKQYQIPPPPPPPPPEEYYVSKDHIKSLEKIQLTVIVNSDKVDGRFNG